MAHNQFSLLGTKRFLPFFITQFLGAFNDNVFKQGLIILLTFSAIQITPIPVEIRASLCQALFILPFFLFSATAGQIADAWDKATLIRLIKGFEIIIVGIASVGFLYQNFYCLMIALFAFGLHSAFFGPIKYSILPQTLTQGELLGGNALVETGTSLAILIGSILGGYFIADKDLGIQALCFLFVGIAILGFISALYIPRTGSATDKPKISLNFVRESWLNIQFLRSNRTVFLSIIGISWFWFYGVSVQSNIPALTKNVLGGSESAVILILTVLSVGVGIGSLLCEKLSGKSIEIGLVPFGAIGLTIFGVDIWLATLAHTQIVYTHTLSDFVHSPGNLRVLWDFFGIGVFSGFYIVPLYALVQSRSEPSHRSRTIAGNNILNAFFMVVASLLNVLLLKIGFSLTEVFAILAILSALVSVYIFTLVPEFLMRFIIWMFMSIFYRVDKKNIDNIPEEGACVLVCNHVSFFDALVLATAIRRPPRFVMDHNIFKIPVISFIFKTAKAIPIAPQKVDAHLLQKAYDDIAEALANGEVVCIFPEGKITSDGEINSFKNGIQQIIERTPVPVIPLALQGLWGSFSSRRGGAAFKKFPRRFRSHIAVTAAAAVPPHEASPQHLEDIVRSLRGEWK